MLSYQVLFLLAVCGMNATPIVLKESSANGESVIAISSSDPAVEKYLLELVKTRAAREHSDIQIDSDTGPSGQVVQSFSIATPQRTIAGTGRSFANTQNQPFLPPFFTGPDLEGFDLNNWFRSIEQLYEPSFAGDGAARTLTAIHDNGRPSYGNARNLH